MSDWQTIDTAPHDGSEVRVGHSLDDSSMKADSIFRTTGRWTGQGWECSAAFVCIDDRLRWQPTHWLPPTNPEHTK